MSESALRGWAKLADRPLQAVPGMPNRYTWAQLFEFCEAHPNLYKAPAILQRRMTTPKARAVTDAGAAVADLRAVADAHLNAILEAVRAAEATARTNREQLENLISAYDAAIAATVP